MATLKNLKVNSTGAANIAQGTDAQRPATIIRWTTSGATVISGSATTTSTTWTCPAGVTQIEVLVVGAGGGTGWDVGGGGGGGGVVYRPAYPVTPTGVYTISVGAGGGSGQSGGTKGSNGGNTSFDTLVAIGGGGGGGYPGVGQALNGGSGGGGGDYTGGAQGGSAGSPVPDQGHVGGRSSPSTWGTGGGGGAGGAGFPNYGANTTSALGGRPLFFNISGTREGYGGGGYGQTDGGAVYASGIDYNNVTVGTYGFGANGTGSPNGSPYSGSAGCVIIRYSTQTTAVMRYNTTNNLMETVVRGRPFSPLGLTSSKPAASAQEIVDNYPGAANGVYWIDNGLSVVQVYCEFVNGEGWMMAGNIQSENYSTNGSFSWNDYPNWMQDGSALGSVTNPYGTIYRNQDVWRYQPARKIKIKSHNHGSEFGSGSSASFPLLMAYAGRTLKEIFRNYDGYAGAGGIIISGTFDNSVGYGKTRYAAGLWKDPIARSLTNNAGVLRINHVLDNNGVRLLTSEQNLETGNTDRTRGLGNAFAIPGNSVLNTDGSGYNSIVGPYVEDDGTGSSTWQFANGIFPDNTNNSARAGQWNNQTRWIHYAIFIK